MKFELKGKIPSKKNTWFRSKWGKVYQGKQKEIDAFIWQLRDQTKDISTLPIKIQQKAILEIYSDNRNDLDNQICTILDILQDAGVVENDRLIRHIEASKYHDIKNPRVKIELKSVK